MKVIQLTPQEQSKSRLLRADKEPSQVNNELHRHPEIQISLIVKGEGILTTGEYSQPFKPGEVYIIAPNQPYMFKSTWIYADCGDVQEADIIHISFDFKRIPEAFLLLQELEPIRKFLGFCTRSLQLPQAHEEEVSTLIRNISGRKNMQRLLGLLEIFHYFSNDVTGWKSLSTGFANYGLTKAESSRMSDVYRYTMDNYSRDITLQTIASVAHITPHAFCKYFKQHTGKTYNHFLNEVRVNEACKRIISGEYDNFSAIAYTTGFKGASNFNRVFKKTAGMSPSDYKKEFCRKTA